MYKIRSELHYFSKESLDNFQIKTNGDDPNGRDN